jgi:uncharacterized membrane protein YhaH (DUF805 family)
LKIHYGHHQAKVFWVGLIFLATGFVGILTYREWTPPSIIGFTVITGVSTILSFYLIITCIIPVQYDARYSDLSRPTWQIAELAINSLLIVIGVFSCILGVVSTFIGCCFADCCDNHRMRNRPDYDDPQRIIIIREPGGIAHPSPNIRPRTAS